MRGKKGFTLVELIIVVVIVGILASAAIPMMRANIERARKSEAIAALGAIRTAERLFASQNINHSYAVVAQGNFRSTDLAVNPLADYIADTDLDGHYFSAECYSVLAAGNVFVAVANGSFSTAPGNADVSNYGNIAMGYDGSIVNY